MKKNKLKAKSNKSIIREINFDPEKGAAAAFAGSSVNGAAELEPASSEIVSQHELLPEQLRTFSFPQTLIPIEGGATVLRLRQQLKLVLIEGSDEFVVKDWDIRMPTNQVFDLPRQIARKFLQFFSKADGRALLPAEEVVWCNILGTVDATRFSIERSPPHYVEGQLKQQHPTRVEWADGQTEWLTPKASTALSVLEPGDHFSAYAKLGRNSETLSLSRIMFIQPAD